MEAHPCHGRFVIGASAKRRRGEIEMEQQDFPLPSSLPRPMDDGASDHLRQMRLPPVLLQSTAGRLVDISDLGAPRTVIYCYPMTGVIGKPLPEGWDMIPGARGCTPQACSFRDRHREFLDHKVAVLGLSTQTAEYQLEMVRRLKLPFDILSDCEFALCDALRLPTFETAGMRLLKRLTLIVRDGRIEHVFYPVFPPDKNVEEVLRWLKSNPKQD
jgi:peroxiredoxin